MKTIKKDIKEIIDNCEGICYLKGDDFGAYPIKKMHKKKTTSPISEVYKGD